MTLRTWGTCRLLCEPLNSATSRRPRGLGGCPSVCVQGFGEARLRVLAVGLRMGDLPRARQAADVWLTFRAPGGTGDATKA